MKKTNPKNSPPLAGGDEGEGEKKGDIAPSPEPSPVKGEGKLDRVNVYFGVLLGRNSIGTECRAGGDAGITKASIIEKTYCFENLPPAFAEAASRRQAAPLCLSNDRETIAKEG